MVAAAGHISGGVYNPAVAVGLMATGKLPLARGAGFIVAQVLGAVDAVQLGTPLPGGRFSTTQALLMELVLTFFLMFVIFGVAADKRDPAVIAGL